MLPRTIAGKYDLVQEIGCGAMGHIWKAFDQNLRRTVALKVMPPANAPSEAARARFVREALAIAKLQSPHVVQVFDAGIDDGVPYIVMELLSGEDLESRLDRVGRLPLAALVPIAEQCARALTAAQARGIVHRDIKPANIFIERHDTSGEAVKILDFGVAAMLTAEEIDLGPPLTTDGAIVGTPLYMSPEQIRGGRADHRSDLWSLAALLYRALTGEPPFYARSLAMLIVHICADAHRPPSAILPTLPTTVDVFFEKALAKDPNKRFQTAAELAAAFTTLASPHEQGPVKILVVDDEPHIAKLVKLHFRKQIKQAAYDFVFAQDGENALEELRSHPDIDVVLTDINMPRMDGLTFLSHVNDVDPFVRTVVVSAYGDMRNIRTAMNRGAFDFIVKPIDFDDLEVTIEKTLRLTRELRKNARSNEENTLLRKFVSPSLLDRITARVPLHSSETWSGTVAIIELPGLDSVAAGTSPSDHVRMLNANFEVIVPAIAQHGGVVHKFFQAAVMVLFLGESHCVRAFEACLEVRAQLSRIAQKVGGGSPFALGVSIGIATGEMITGAIGSNALDRLDFAVLDEVPKQAVRLSAAAGKNQVLVSAAALDAVSGAFVGTPVEPRTTPEEIRAFELLGKAQTAISRRSVDTEAETLPDSMARGG